jgi:serine/threonine protein kinase
VFACCLQGLSYLHSKAVTHFDLKTANLLFTIKVGQREPGSSSSWLCMLQLKDHHILDSTMAHHLSLSAILGTVDLLHAAAAAAVRRTARPS